MSDLRQVFVKLWDTPGAHFCCFCAAFSTKSDKNLHFSLLLEKPTIIAPAFCSRQWILSSPILYNLFFLFFLFCIIYSFVISIFLNPQNCWMDGKNWEEIILCYLRCVIKLHKIFRLKTWLNLKRYVILKLRND